MPNQNSNTGITAYGMPTLMGVKYVAAYGKNLSTGDNDLYTVPAGRKALCGAGATAGRGFNSSAGAIDSVLQIKVGGVYYKISTVNNSSAGGQASFSIPAPIILAAGESLSVNIATTSGFNMTFPVIEFDAAETKIATARILALANGDNTLFTCPAGFNAAALTAGGVAGTGNIMAICNNSGGSRNYTFYSVASGDSVGSTNQMSAVTAVADKATSNSYNTVMSSGDAAVINTNSGTAGQFAWSTYFLLPN